MEGIQTYQEDVREILSHRYDMGWDYWTTIDKRLLKGSPFSTIDCALYLAELGMDIDSPLVQEIADLMFSTWREDGRFKLYPQGMIYPCQTIHATNVLCGLGYANDERIQKTFHYLMDNRHKDGGWRCNKFSYGRGPETAYSNPFPTLIALNALRYSPFYHNQSLDAAIEFLLSHWKTKKPLGPCHYGIGTLFMQVEYPFRTYNLFYYVYVLSFYPKTKSDKRFWEAFSALKANLFDEKVVIERTHPKLTHLSFSQKGKPSLLATTRYQEILVNLNNSD